MKDVDKAQKKLNKTRTKLLKKLSLLCEKSSSSFDDYTTKYNELARLVFAYGESYGKRAIEMEKENAID